MVRVSDLYALQEIDTELDALDKALADLRIRLEADDGLTEVRERIVEFDAAARIAAVEVRAAEAEAEDGRAKVAGVESKLYDGAVTLARELQDLQKELEILQRHQQEREELLLEVLARLDRAQSGAGEARQELATAESARTAELQNVAAEVADLESRSSSMQDRRVAALRPIDERTMALYDRLRRMRAGRAVARVRQGACLGCRIALPSTIFHKARSGLAIVQCSSCERILYVG